MNNGDQQSLPRLLIISEATFSESGTGINRTLVNLFQDYPQTNLLVISPRKALLANPPMKTMKDRVLGVTYSNIFGSLQRYVPGRLQNWAERTNLTRLSEDGIKEMHHIESFKPQTILLCTNSIECMLIGNLISSKFDTPFFTYAMDDWRDLEKTVWKGGSGKDLINKLLSSSSGLIMISESLDQNYRMRFDLDPKKVLIVHNPVKLDPPTDLPVEYVAEKNTTFEIAYAGSVWSMHYDALMLCAAAVKQLRDLGHDIHLKLYIPETFWKQHEEEWRKQEVVFGGFIPYQHLRSKLQQADLLLVSSSFQTEYQHLSFSSVQTKLTDYMAASRPILSVGPDGCSCNEFVKRWDCGLTYSLPNLEGLAELIGSVRDCRDRLSALGRNGQEAVRKHFTTNVVNPKLYSFLAGESAATQSADVLSWTNVCKSLSRDKQWDSALSLLTTEERIHGVTLQRLWRLMDQAWFETKERVTDEPFGRFLESYYQHPVWLLLGAFTESDAESVRDRLAAVRLISTVTPTNVLDFGGGIGTAGRLAASHLLSIRQLDIVDVGPFAETIRAHHAHLPAVRVLSKPAPPYDAIICTEVLEHLPDPISTIVQMNQMLRSGGALAISYSFAPGIECHLPHNFHLKSSMLWIIRALGFGFYGFERRGSTVYGFIKHRDVDKRMLQNARWIARLSKLRFPIHRLLLALRGL